MKFVIARLRHETHAFVSKPTALHRFSLTRKPLGDDAEEILRSRKSLNNALFAYIDRAKVAGHEYTIALAAEAMPSGRVEDEAFEWMCNQITVAVSEGCDAVLLDLHGAMATTSFDDAEGEGAVTRRRPDSHG